MSTEEFRADIGPILINLLKCSHCKMLCLPPIFMCQNGHLICIGCQCVVTECPICQCQGRPTLRNLMAAELSSHALVPCKMADQGCTTVCKVKEVPAHLEQCSFGYKCLFESCRQWRGSVSNLDDHGRNVHVDHYFECAATGSTLKTDESDTDSHLELFVSAKMEEFQEKGEEIKMNASQYMTSMISFNDHVFWFLAEISERSKFNVQLRLIGPVMQGASLSTEFWYQLEFHSVDGTRKLSYNKKVRSLAEPPYRDVVFADNLTLEPFLEDDGLMFTLSMSSECGAITPRKRALVQEGGSSASVDAGEGGWRELKFKDTEWGIKSTMLQAHYLHATDKQDSDSDDAFFDLEASPDECSLESLELTE